MSKSKMFPGKKKGKSKSSIFPKAKGESSIFPKGKSKSKREPRTRHSSNPMFPGGGGSSGYPLDPVNIKRKGRPIGSGSGSMFGSRVRGAFLKRENASQPPPGGPTEVMPNMFGQRRPSGRRASVSARGFGTPQFQFDLSRLADITGRSEDELEREALALRKREVSLREQKEARLRGELPSIEVEPEKAEKVKKETEKDLNGDLARMMVKHDLDELKVSRTPPRSIPAAIEDTKRKAREQARY